VELKKFNAAAPEMFFSVSCPNAFFSVSHGHQLMSQLATTLATQLILFKLFQERSQSCINRELTVESCDKNVTWFFIT